MESKAYYAVIPANVRYDKSIPMGAKLLYGEITALCNQEGFCWATNNYFSELYEVSESTIKRWINALIDSRYVLKNIEYEDDGKTVLRRCLGISNEPTPLQKWTEGGSKNEPTPPSKNEPYNNTSINNTDEYITHNSACVYTSEEMNPPQEEKPFKPEEYQAFIKQYEIIDMPMIGGTLCNMDFKKISEAYTKSKWLRTHRQAKYLKFISTHYNEIITGYYEDDDGSNGNNGESKKTKGVWDDDLDNLGRIG